MCAIDEDQNAARREADIECLSDLFAQTLLKLGSRRQRFDHARQSTQPHNVVTRHIRHVRVAHKR